MPQAIEAVDLHGVNVLEDGLVPSWLLSAECQCESPECKPTPIPTEPPDTIPG